MDTLFEMYTVTHPVSGRVTVYISNKHNVCQQERAPSVVFYALHLRPRLIGNLVLIPQS